MEKRKIGILGSTGSIGTQTLEIVRDNPDLVVEVLTANKNTDLLEMQIREFHPRLAVLMDEKAASDLKVRIADLPVKVASGMDGLIEAATMDEISILVTAVVGMIGLQPTIAAIKAGKDIALANKETLVTAGHIIMPLAKEYQVSILPVDSEHSAIFQSLQGNDTNPIDKILLTASGGPFRGRSREELAQVTLQDALKHPNWTMGQKITIDSATMVNKGLEVMEAKWLFDVTPDRIEVVVHPQSVVHSAVQYADGAVIAQLGTPDMKVPIQYALFYPNRRYLKGKRLDLFALRELTFEKPDPDAFYGLALARKALEAGGNMPTVFNAANEYAVDAFLHEKITFLQIPEWIEGCMQEITYQNEPTVEQILSTQEETLAFIRSRFL